MELSLRPPASANVGATPSAASPHHAPQREQAPLRWDEGSTVTRRRMMRLDAMLLVLGSALAGFAGFIAFSVRANYASQPFSWAVTLAGCGVLTAVFAAVGYAAARSEHTRLLVFYFYASLSLVAIMALVVIAALAFQDALDVYVSHHWDTPVLHHLRSLSCCGTKSDALAYLRYVFDGLGALALLVVVLLIWSCHCTVTLASIPIIMHNMMSITNGLQIIVGVGVVFQGRVVAAHRELEAGEAWIGSLFTALGAAFVTCPWAGIYGAVYKRTRWLSINIASNILLILAMVVCAVGGLVFAPRLTEHYRETDGGRIACSAGLWGCSNCSSVDTPANATASLHTAESSTVLRGFDPCPLPGDVAAGNEPDSVIVGCKWVPSSISTSSPSGSWMCPEAALEGVVSSVPCGPCPQWTEHDIAVYVETNLKFLAATAIFCLVLLVVGTGGAHLLRESYQGYQCQSI